MDKQLPLYKGRWPDLFIIDDLENSEAVESEELRKKLKIWFKDFCTGCVVEVYEKAPHCTWRKRDDNRNVIFVEVKDKRCRK